MKKITTIATIVMLVCCGEVDAENTAGNFAEYTTKETYPEVVEINLDDMTFNEAFNIEYRAKGEGRTFWWRGSQYTTNLAENLDEHVIYHTTKNEDIISWVQNNDDPDDYCYYNKRDECGVCNGNGKTTWWIDRDGDGLGDHRESIESCTNPNIINESLNEGSGDLGILN